MQECCWLINLERPLPLNEPIIPIVQDWKKDKAGETNCKLVFKLKTSFLEETIVDDPVRAHLLYLEVGTEPMKLISLGKICLHARRDGSCGWLCQVICSGSPGEFWGPQHQCAQNRFLGVSYSQFLNSAYQREVERAHSEKNDGKEESGGMGNSYIYTTQNAQRDNSSSCKIGILVHHESELPNISLDCCH